LLYVLCVDVSRRNLCDGEDDSPYVGVVPEVVSGNTREENVGKLKRLTAVAELGVKANLTTLAEHFVGNETIVVNGNHLVGTHGVMDCLAQLLIYDCQSYITFWGWFVEIRCK
jgi:hypothetical protein